MTSNRPVTFLYNPTPECDKPAAAWREDASGSWTVTVVPCSASLSSSRVPRWATAMRRAIGRPRPVPSGLVEKSGSKTRLSACSEIPVPLSLTVTSIA